MGQGRATSDRGGVELVRVDGPLEQLRRVDVQGGGAGQGKSNDRHGDRRTQRKPSLTPSSSLGWPMCVRPCVQFTGTFNQTLSNDFLMIGNSVSHRRLVSLERFTQLTLSLLPHPPHRPIPSRPSRMPIVSNRSSPNRG